MVVEAKQHVCDGYLFKWFVAAGLAWLEHNRENVNRLNVFPVPDGDTGTNMCLTLQKAYEAIAHLDDQHVGLITAQVAKGALRGGRGNSGVILSQLLHGFAHTLHNHDAFDVRLLALAYRKGVDAAYKAVLKPVEGTILTVARESAEALERYAQKHDDLVGALDTLLEAAHSALIRTPDLLPVLKKAGVVDSGGAGLVFILEGMSRILHGESVYMDHPMSFSSEEIDSRDALPDVDLSADDQEGYGFDVQFLMRGQNMNVESVRADIDAMGWSTLVVGDDRLIKVHVHVHDPGTPLSYAVKSGAVIDDIVVENMQAQYETYLESRLKHLPAEIRVVEGVAVVVVANGDGLRRLFYEDLNAAYVIPGGQTMNPSTEDFLQAIAALPNHEILLLPNNKNIILAAQQAAAMTEGKIIRVVPSMTIPQGISAMLAYANASPQDGVDEIAQAMQTASAQIITGEITTATRDSHLNGLTIKQGQWIGLLGDQLVITGDELESLLADLLRQAVDDVHELVTLYYGQGMTETQAQTLLHTLSRAFPHLEFELVYGGQPLYPYIFSVE